MGISLEERFDRLIRKYAHIHKRFGHGGIIKKPKQCGMMSEAKKLWLRLFDKRAAELINEIIREGKQ